jgi:hypothetical protein
MTLSQLENAINTEQKKCEGLMKKKAYNLRLLQARTRALARSLG